MDSQPLTGLYSLSILVRSVSNSAKEAINKKATCKLLGGVCNKKLRTDSFGEIAVTSKQHSAEVFLTMYSAHLIAMNVVQEH